MKRIVLAMAVVGSLIGFSASEADAVVCARGIYRAGCVGPYGAVGVRRGVYGGAVYRGRVVRRGGVVVRRTYVHRY